MNCTNARVPNLEFTRDTFLVVICYVFVFVLAFLGNVTMLLILFRNQLSKRRRVHSLLLHMTIAHLLVTLIYVPKEIVHNITVVWTGGDTLCRLCKFFDVFSVALSANILICLSLDRFFSILYPLYSINAKKHVLRMIAVAWILAFLSGLPQIYIFRTANHPCFPWYSQCVSIDLISLLSPKVTFWFSVFNITQVYFLPLLVTIICYGSILISISIKSDSWRGSKLLKRKSNGAVGTNQALLLRRAGGQDNFQRAKNRTLQMSIIVVFAFLFCWTPYTVAMFIRFLRASDTKPPIPILVSKLLYAFAVFNSAISPFLYGYFSFNIKSELEQLFCCTVTTNEISSTLAGRRHAIRQRVEHSLTNNSTTGPLSPNTFASCRNNIAANATRVRLSNVSKQTMSFDDESSNTAQVRRPSRLLTTPPNLTDIVGTKFSLRNSPSNTSINKSVEAP